MEKEYTNADMLLYRRKAQKIVDDLGYPHVSVTISKHCRIYNDGIEDVMYYFETENSHDLSHADTSGCTDLEEEYNRFLMRLGV